MDKDAIKREVLSTIKDMVVAVIVVCLVLGSVVLYTGNWPPLVVVESGSMRHSSESLIGPIDAGDLVLVKSIDAREDVITYVEGVESLTVKGTNAVGTVVVDRTVSGKKAPHNTYGEAGDVIIYYKNGLRDETPIIHRAMMWVEYNETGGGSFDVPDIGAYGITGVLTLYSVGYLGQTVDIDFGEMLARNFSATGRPHGGFITLGDNNHGRYDQGGSMRDRPVNGDPVEPVQVGWVFGKARGEVPWFGAIKLHFAGDPNPYDEVGASGVPPNAWNNLFLTIGGLIFAAILIDVISHYRHVRKERKQGAEESGESAEEGEEENGTGAEEEKETRGSAGEDRAGENGLEEGVEESVNVENEGDEGRMGEEEGGKDKGDERRGGKMGNGARVGEAGGEKELEDEAGLSVEPAKE